jgi:hypothetical protein
VSLALSEFVYAPYTLPSFAMPPKDLQSLRIMHGSCRKPNGGGYDALALLDDLIAASAGTPLQRPHQLCCRSAGPGSATRLRCLSLQPPRPHHPVLPGAPPVQSAVNRRPHPAGRAVDRGRLTDRRTAATGVGTRTVVVTGLISFGTAMAWIAGTVETATPYWTTIVPQMLLMGRGMGLIATPATESIMLMLVLPPWQIIGWVAIALRARLISHCDDLTCSVGPVLLGMRRLSRAYAGR